MFTGIIQHIGTVKGWKGDRLFVNTPIIRAK